MAISNLSKLEIVETCYTYRYVMVNNYCMKILYVSNMYIGMYILFVLLHCELRKVCM